MIVCIAEKPSVAHELARILGATGRRDGYDEGNGYQVTWTYGHLCELKYPEDYRPEWRRWSLAALPMIPQRFGIRLKRDAGIEKQFAVIERLMAGAERIVNCGDAGQEGELIQRWVMQKAHVTCPVDRLWTSSMTEEAIREGFASLRAQSHYDGLYRAGLCRAIGDWILGMNATRLYTLKYGRTGQGVPPLSIGRVQTPTLALIVQRQHEIESFRPEPYWVLSTRYRDTLFTAVMDEGERGFRTEAEGAGAVARIEGKPFRVADVQRKNGSEAPPRLFDLTGLQVECNRRLGYSAEQTLSVIQTLYEKKLTTYPRVDTTFLPDDVYPQCKRILNGIAGSYAAELAPLRGAALKKSRKVFDNSKITDHHAIIPTGVAPQALTDLERNVYDMVARRFIAAFYPDCRFSSTVVTGDVDGTAFRATGRVVTQQGWRALYAHETRADAADSADGQGLPRFAVGEEGPHTPSLEQKTTQPPKAYTEATLLRAMETAGRTVDDEELRDALKANGIGRPSTRAAIIETLFKRGYVRRQRKNLVATPTGVELIGLIREDLLKSAELTGRWEKKLRLIETGDYDAGAFVGELKEMVTAIVGQVLADSSNRRVAAQPAETLPPVLEKARRADRAAAQAAKAPAAPRVRAGSKCPLCGEGKVIKGKTAYGCSRWKEGCTWRKPFGK